MTEDFTKLKELTYEIDIGKAMNSRIYTVRPEMRVKDLREIFKINKISGTPVLNGNNELIGIISIEDFIKCLAAGETDVFIKDKMTTDVVTLFPDEPLIHAVNKFDKHGYGRLPVIERDSRHIVGMISKGDILRALLKALEIEYREEEIQRYRASHIFEDITADRVSLIIENQVEGQNFKRGGEAASSIKKSLLRLGIHPDTVRRAAIAAYEAEMNIVIYTKGGYISAHIEKDIIRIKAIDKGPGIPDIERAMKPGYSTASAEIMELGFGAGMGLPNIKKCADEMKIDSAAGSGTFLEIVIHLKKGDKEKKHETA
jgi:CBS domain-containing protein/anti-sigma regulatory factor (Ser/Thr protein kinase)